MVAVSGHVDILPAMQRVEGDLIAKLTVIAHRLSTGARVKVTVLAHEKGPKVHIFKYRPKQRYRVRKGHRQNYTRLRVDEIVV